MFSRVSCFAQTGYACRRSLAIMPELRKLIDPDHCLAKEAEYRQLATDGQLTPERRTEFWRMAETWAGLARESDPGRRGNAPGLEISRAQQRPVIAGRSGRPAVR
jgi:hypothetical protein